MKGDHERVWAHLGVVEWIIHRSALRTGRVAEVLRNLEVLGSQGREKQLLDLQRSEGHAIHYASNGAYRNGESSAGRLRTAGRPTPYVTSTVGCHLNHGRWCCEQRQPLTAPM